MQKVLVVVDMQNDFIDGALGTKEAVAIVPGVKEKIKNFDGVVLFTRDTHETYYLDTQEGKKLPVPHCITFVGLCTDICVISNALLAKASLPEVPIIVDAKCCAGVTPESHENALKAMEACQIQIDR